MPHDLRKSLIHLAYENPELQAHLLPMLKESARGVYSGRPEAWELSSEYEGTDAAARELTQALLQGNREIDKAGKALAQAVRKSLEKLKGVGYKHRDAGANAPGPQDAGHDAVEDYLEATFAEVRKMLS